VVVSFIQFCRISNFVVVIFSKVYTFSEATVIPKQNHSVENQEPTELPHTNPLLSSHTIDTLLTDASSSASLSTRNTTTRKCMHHSCKSGNVITVWSPCGPPQGGSKVWKMECQPQNRQMRKCRTYLLQLQGKPSGLVTSMSRKEG
jgi:hypothetical protein